MVSILPKNTLNIAKMVAINKGGDSQDQLKKELCEENCLKSSIITQTAGQILGHAILDCQWIPRNSNSTSTIAAYQRFPEIVREWIRFKRNVKLTTAGGQFPPPGGQFDTYPAINVPLRLEGDVKDHFYLNVLAPVQVLLPPGAFFGVTTPRFVGSSDHVLSTNNFTVAKMPVEYKTRHNLNLIGYHLRILSQIFGQMAFINDNVGNRLRHVVTDNVDPYYPDDSESSDDDDYYYYVSSGRKRKRASESSIVAWKTCDAYKQQDEMKTLNHEACIYSILKECQGHDVPRLFYKGYIYDGYLGYLFALALQLIEDSRHIDLTRLTKKEKELIVNQLRSIHNLGVLHNDISPRNILYEPKSCHYFFIDFGLSEIVDNKSSKLHKEEARLKKILQL
ncbi:unnamed protein product [Rhizophagus irregularis]|uniref:Protein kinase domain-containing protein n=1 Tax=Rhizophagus irregularis TaxID=588596 RepID=A0A915Z3P8_9GLOM|nr:unnamed protein product [Rhizophagus irregularis]